jgi:hypothetical protein
MSERPHQRLRGTLVGADLWPHLLALLELLFLTADP